MKKVFWLFGGLGFVAMGLGLLAVPSQWEGLVLVPISPGHALSILDTIALVPLLIGVVWLYLGLWQRRRRLYESLQSSPQPGSLIVFASGLGLGLLLASAFSSFFWWWTIGAVLYGVMLIVTLILAA